MDFIIGDCVRLKKASNWLSRYAPLAKSGRTGTITGFTESGSVNIMFDVIKQGAQPIYGTFNTADIALSVRKITPITSQLL